MIFVNGDLRCDIEKIRNQLDALICSPGFAEENLFDFSDDTVPMCGDRCSRADLRLALRASGRTLEAVMMFDRGRHAAATLIEFARKVLELHEAHRQAGPDPDGIVRPLGVPWRR